MITVTDADAVALRAVHARQRNLDRPVVASKRSCLLPGVARPRVLRLSDDNAVLTYSMLRGTGRAAPGQKGAAKGVNLKLLKHVFLQDATQLTVLRFTTTTRTHVFDFHDPGECLLYINALRACHAALSDDAGRGANSGKGRKQPRKLPVPPKAFGFLSAAVHERAPAFMEPHRSHIYGQVPQEKLAPTRL